MSAAAEERVPPFSGGIHPAQIAWALEIFSPGAEEVARARELAAACDKAPAEGVGSVNVNGTMVDVASIRIVMNTACKAGLIGIQENAGWRTTRAA